MTRLFYPAAIALAASLIAVPATTVAAQTQPGAEDAATEQQPASPEQVARSTVETLLARLNENRPEYRENPKALYTMIEEVLVPRVDVDYMSKLVLGRNWRKASPEQRDRFAVAFKQLVIQSYGDALLGFDKEKVEYQPVRAAEGAEDITFRAQVTTDNGDTVPVTLDMHLVDDNWKVYNGTVGNLSFVTNYRGQFNSQIRGGGLESLIAKLEDRYVDASGSAQ